MTGARLTAALECANDAGGRCALWPSGDAHACYGVSHDTATSCAFAAASAGAARAALTGTGATPQSEGLVRVRTQVCFHTPAPVPWGRSRSINPYAGRRFERRFEAADHPFADRPAVWQPGITEQGRGTPDGSGHSPSRQVRDVPVPGDRWPSRTGLLDGSAASMTSLGWFVSATAESRTPVRVAVSMSNSTTRSPRDLEVRRHYLRDGARLPVGLQQDPVAARRCELPESLSCI